MFGLTKQHLIGFLIALIYWPYSLTFRYKLHVPSNYNVNENKLFAFWHQDDLVYIPFFKYSRYIIMVSLSKDGRMLAAALKFFGYEIISGSSSRGGISALIQAIKKVRQGSNFAMAVDGPRGPIFKVKEGIILMSQKTRKPIYPARAFPHKFYTFNKAWNKPRLPYPFSKIDIVFGEPGFYDQAKLEEVLNSLKIPA
ncbi:MAG: hypothetical protein A2202_07490 [Bdellovibrionales bacterium RIFOXYA1_FULL_36_14]|nr:MAG: hypothetical protein A2202_07490 [Bdellovibrionales bacterium RIFOXYA1_FULL_36_14]